MANVENLTLAAYSDRELLGVIADLADNDGWVETAHLATRAFGAGIQSEPKRQAHAHRCVGIRLGWMRRYGVVERDKSAPGRWRLSSAGEDFLSGRLRAAQSRAVTEADDGQMLHLATTMAERYYAAGPTAATMMRRAWQHGLSKRGRRR